MEKILQKKNNTKVTFNKSLWKNGASLPSRRQIEAINYCLKNIKESPIFSYVKRIYLYGSVARGEGKWSSDVDIFLVLDDDTSRKKLKDWIIALRSLRSKGDILFPEYDLHYAFEETWECEKKSTFLSFVQKEGILLWS